MKTNENLLNAVIEYKGGNAEVFSRIYDESYAYLYTCVIHIVKDEDTAEDMLQDTYMEIVKNIGSLDNDESFLSWAAMIANRKCFARIKKNQEILVDNTVDDEEVDFFDNIKDDDALIPENILDDQAKIEIIRGIIDELSDIQRACVIGFYYNEQKQDEIARGLGVPVNTVKSHLNRAKAKIKESVGETEKKQGIKLYSFAPFMLLFFAKEVKACEVTPMSETLLDASRSVGVLQHGAGASAGSAEISAGGAANSSATGATASNLASNTAVTAAKTVAKWKLAAIIGSVAVAVVGTAGVVTYVSNKPKAEVSTSNHTSGDGSGWLTSKLSDSENSNAGTKDAGNKDAGNKDAGTLTTGISNSGNQNEETYDKNIDTNQLLQDYADKYTYLSKQEASAYVQSSYEGVYHMGTDAKKVLCDFSLIGTGPINYEIFDYDDDGENELLIVRVDGDGIVYLDIYERKVNEILLADEYKMKQCAFNDRGCLKTDIVRGWKDDRAVVGIYLDLYIGVDGDYGEIDFWGLKYSDEKWSELCDTSVVGTAPDESDYRKFNKKMKEFGIESVEDSFRICEIEQNSDYPGEYVFDEATNDAYYIFKNTRVSVAYKGMKR